MTGNVVASDGVVADELKSAGRAFCGYCHQSFAVFYVGHDAGGSYTCGRHLGHFVRRYQAEVPTEWLKVCVLTDE